ncbi:MAG: hypothetical protein KKC50_08270 [Candidatus Omnitrophica bacterium]|nr:hypothetical protein [Candidatus Omnitrophota bacterium]
MGLFNRSGNKAERYMNEMRKQAEAQIVKNVERLVVMKQLMPEAQELAQELGITDQEALIYLKAKEGISSSQQQQHDNGNDQGEGGFDWSGMLGKMSDYGKSVQQMGVGLTNIGYEKEVEDETRRTTKSKGRGERKTRRQF